MPIQLNRQDDVFILTMDDGENRMNRVWLDAMNHALDEVDAAPGSKALVTTGSGKFYSNGLDLERLVASGEAEMAAFVADDERLFARLITTPYITVAACNGHTFAAGAMLALCHDFRVMREDRGYFCLPEVDLGIPFSLGMDALIKRRLPQAVAHEAMVTGTRYGGAAAASKGIVTEATSEDQVLPTAVAMAAALAQKAGPTMATIKSRMYADLIELLSNSPGTSVPEVP
ncbi:MAG: enoyl-CoA hydratase/isomerase family protein [Acidimicrobiia bacterium]|nr:enoyl-CoA hydratase/isomerase family protein [Acidimicrobiia bacterium]